MRRITKLFSRNNITIKISLFILSLLVLTGALYSGVTILTFKTIIKDAYLQIFVGYNENSSRAFYQNIINAQGYPDKVKISDDAIRNILMNKREYGIEEINIINYLDNEKPVIISSNKVENIRVNLVDNKYAGTDRNITKSVIRNINKDIYSVITPVGPPGYDWFMEIIYSKDKSILYEKINGYKNQILGKVLIGIFIITILTGIITYGFIREKFYYPIRELYNASICLARKNFAIKLKYKLSGEFNVLYKSYNIMAKKLKKSYEELMSINGNLSDIVSTASHDINNNLGIIMGKIDNLNAGVYGELNKEQQKAVNYLKNKITDNQNLLFKYLDTVRCYSGTEKKHDKVNLSMLVNGIIEDYKEHIMEKELKIYRYLNEIAYVSGDEIKLKQAITNIIDNAVKYNRENGKIIVSMNKKTTYAELKISDSGIGIDDSMKEDIFKKYVKVGDRGYGLGLYITKKIIDEHGGKIWVQSTKEGSSFNIHLRCYEERAVI